MLSNGNRGIHSQTHSNTHPKILLLLCVVVAAGMCLSSLCLAKTGCIHIQTYTHTDWWEGFMKYAVQMDSGAMISKSSFVKIGSGIQKLNGRDSQTHRQNGDHISLLSAFKNK
jgi:hypothetical protein